MADDRPLFVAVCGNCRFGLSNRGAAGLQVECHRYPRVGGQWPLLYQGEWCGDWEPDRPSQVFLGAHGGRIVDGIRAGGPSTHEALSGEDG